QGIKNGIRIRFAPRSGKQKGDVHVHAAFFHDGRNPDGRIRLDELAVAAQGGRIARESERVDETAADSGLMYCVGNDAAGHAAWWCAARGKLAPQWRHEAGKGGEGWKTVGQLAADGVGVLSPKAWQDQKTGEIGAGRHAGSSVSVGAARRCMGTGHAA